jgi:hypothetical protein
VNEIFCRKFKKKKVNGRRLSAAAARHTGRTSGGTWWDLDVLVGLGGTWSRKSGTWWDLRFKFDWNEIVSDTETEIVIFLFLFLREKCFCVIWPAALTLTSQWRDCVCGSVICNINSVAERPKKETRKFPRRLALNEEKNVSFIFVRWDLVGLGIFFCSRQVSAPEVNRLICINMRILKI